MPKIKNYLLIIIITCSGPIFASYDTAKTSCIGIHDQVALHLNSGLDKYIVTNDVATKNKCPTETFYSIENSNTTEINGWIVFYGNSELESRMVELSRKNKELFLKEFDINLPTKDNENEIIISQMNVSSFVRLAKSLCDVHLGYEERAGNVSVTLNSVKKISINEFCSSIPTILAVNDLKITENASLLMITLSESL